MEHWTEQPLRAIEDSTLVYPADKIIQGFGSADLTSTIASGVITSRKRHRSFRLICGHIITEPSQLGGCCPWCKAGIVANNSAIAFAPMQLDLLCSPCSACFHYCKESPCPLSGCTSHVVKCDDKKRRCPLCFPKYELKQFKETHGFVPSAMRSFWRVLFAKYDNGQAH